MPPALASTAEAPQAARILGPLAGAEFDEALAGEADAEDEMGRQIARQIQGDGPLRLAATGQCILDAPADLLRRQRRQILPRPEPHQDQPPRPGRFRRRDEIQMLVALAREAPAPHGAGEHAAELAVEPGGERRELPPGIGAEDEDRRLCRQALDDIDLHAKLPLCSSYVRTIADGY